MAVHRADDGETAVVVACDREREGDTLSVPPRTVVTCGVTGA